jgi:RNA polymerase sigma factor (sigma-70 family)
MTADEREPNRYDGCVPDVDFAIDRTTADRHPIEVSTVDDREMLRFASFEDFYVGNRASVGRALALTLRDDDLARDAVDEAMARAYQRWAHVGQLENPGGWVYRVGLNWSRSVVRRLRRPTPIWIAQPSDAPDAVVQDPAIDRALDSLNVDQRAVVVCRLLLGLSEHSTSEVLGIRPGTVKSRLARALERLHPLLAPLHTPHEEDPR